MKTEKKIAQIALYDEQKRILMQHRDADAPFAPGLWAFFGGHVEHGESIEQAVKRETLEELGYVLSEPRLVLEERVEVKKGSVVFKFTFVEQCNKKQNIVLGEGQGMKWVTIDEALKLPMNPWNYETLEKLRSKI